MGYGDEIMVSGFARKLHRETGKRVLVIGKNGRPRWHPIWYGNPIMTNEPGPDVATIRNHAGQRHYIEDKTPERWRWIEGPPPVGELYLTDEELAHAPAGEYVLIEPHIKERASPNKDWGFANYERVVALLPHVRFVQAGPGGIRPLKRAERVQTPTFRAACGVLAKARAYVGPEGGFHHAAAALGVPAVVLFGGFISPAVTGYTFQTNLYAGGEPCGMRIPCAHCRAAWGAITPDIVVEALLSILNGGKSHGRTERQIVSAQS